MNIVHRVLINIVQRVTVNKIQRVTITLVQRVPINMEQKVAATEDTDNHEHKQYLFTCSTQTLVVRICLLIS